MQSRSPELQIPVAVREPEKPKSEKKGSAGVRKSEKLSETRCGRRGSRGGMGFRQWKKKGTWLGVRGTEGLISKGEDQEGESLGI